MKRIIMMGMLLTMFAAGSVQGAEQPAEPATAQALYLQAGKLERQGQQVKAAELYERLIELYPASELAVKANDRLLGMLHAAPSQPASQAVSRPEFQPASAPVPAPVADPKARARELLSLHKKALDIADKERRRLSLAFSNFYAHRVNRGELKEQEAQWDQAAEEKVRAELGMGSSQIKETLDTACREVGITGPCDEKALK